MQMTANDKVKPLYVGIKRRQSKGREVRINERDYHFWWYDLDMIDTWIHDTWSCFRLCSRWRSGRGGAQCGRDNPPSEVGHYRQVPKQPSSETQICCLRLWVFLNLYQLWSVKSCEAKEAVMAVREEKNIKKCIPLHVLSPCVWTIHIRSDGILRLSSSG